MESMLEGLFKIEDVHHMNLVENLALLLCDEYWESLTSFEEWLAKVLSHFRGVTNVILSAEDYTSGIGQDV
jgi:hypothetical protein